MTIPHPNETLPHRDGGRLGVELPLLFLDFASRRLRPGGEVYCLITNPIVRGRSAFFELIRPKGWSILEKELLTDRFNQSLYRKDRYQELGIQRIEMWFLHLGKR